MIEELLTGLRISSIILWAMLGIRVAFYSWHVTEQPQAVRAKGWAYWRAALALLAIAAVFLYGPRDILRAHDYITAETGFAMSAAATLLSSLTAALILTGLDIANGGRSRTILVYLSILAVSIVYGLTSGSV